MAGVVTVTKELIKKWEVEWTKGWYKDEIVKYIVDWESETAGGTADGNIASLAGDTKIQGKIELIETSPGANGDRSTNLPDALYDIVLEDDYAADVAGGALGDRSNSVAERVTSANVLVDSELTLKVTNAGITTARKGRLILWVRKL